MNSLASCAVPVTVQKVEIRWSRSHASIRGLQCQDGEARCGRTVHLTFGYCFHGFPSGPAPQLRFDRLQPAYTLLQVVTVCREHDLWEGLIYVYNKGLEDYITPLDYMMQALQSAIVSPREDIDAARQLSSRMRVLSQHILSYLSLCFGGTPNFTGWN